MINIENKADRSGKIDRNSKIDRNGKIDRSSKMDRSGSSNMRLNEFDAGNYPGPHYSNVLEYKIGILKNNKNYNNKLTTNPTPGGTGKRGTILKHYLPSNLKIIQIYGKSGTGKTTLAMDILNEIREIHDSDNSGKSVRINKDINDSIVLWIDADKSFSKIRFSERCKWPLERVLVTKPRNLEDQSEIISNINESPYFSNKEVTAIVMDSISMNFRRRNNNPGWINFSRDLQLFWESNILPLLLFQKKKDCYLIFIHQASQKPVNNTHTYNNGYKNNRDYKNDNDYKNRIYVKNKNNRLQSGFGYNKGQNISITVPFLYQAFINWDSVWIYMKNDDKDMRKKICSGYCSNIGKDFKFSIRL